MIYLVIGAIYCFISFALFRYSARSQINNIKSVGYAVLLNSLPLCFLPYLGEDESRFFRIPIVYFTFISVAFATIYRQKIRFNKSKLPLISLMAIFLCYILVRTLYKNLSLSFLSYYLMWVLNFMIVILLSETWKKYNFTLVLIGFRSWVTSLFIAESIGIIRFILRISEDSNFLVIMNRNGTIFLDMLFNPFLFYLNDTERKMKYRVFLIIKLVFVVLTGSRMGIITFLLSYIFYLILKNRKKILAMASKIIFGLIFLIGVLLSSFGAEMRHRIDVTITTIDIIVNNKEFHAGMRDFARFQMLKDSTNVIKNNLLFGTGIGIESYRKELEKVDPIRMSKPHNFYLSYLAELGIMGFMLLMVIFYYILKQVKKNNKLKELWITEIFIVFLMFTMNEYVALPILWMLFSILYGTSEKARDL